MPLIVSWISNSLFIKEQFLCVKFIQREQVPRQVREPFRFKEDDADIFFVQFRRDRPVGHGFQIAP